MTTLVEAQARTKRGAPNDSFTRAAPSRYGLGLYAERNFKPGDYILEYLGRRLTDKQAETKKQARNYMFDVRKKGRFVCVLDAANKKYSSAARYANAANSEDEQNATFVNRSGHIMLRAIKPIRKGSEILTWYGNDTQRVIHQS